MSTKTNRQKGDREMGEQIEYRVGRSGHRTWPYRVERWARDAGGWVGECVELCRTESAATHAARLLNDGLAAVNPHGLIGCRVELVGRMTHEHAADEPAAMPF